MFKSGGLSVEFESNPPSKVADSVIKLRTVETMVCPNLESLLITAGKFKSAMSQQYDLSYYNEQAASKANEYIKYGQSYLADVASGNFTHSSALVDIKIRAPTVILPFDPNDLSKPMIVVELG
jgi:hypothetical protein